MEGEEGNDGAATGAGAGGGARAGASSKAKSSKASKSSSSASAPDISADFVRAYVLDCTENKNASKTLAIVDALKRSDSDLFGIPSLQEDLSFFTAVKANNLVREWLKSNRGGLVTHWTVLGFPDPKEGGERGYDGSGRSTSRGFNANKSGAFGACGGTSSIDFS